MADAALPFVAETLETRVLLAADYPGAIWTPAASTNYSTTHSDPRWIVIHTTESTAQSTINEFTTPGTIVSANYLVTLTGKIYQFVSDSQTAYHAGNFQYNVHSIGIEHERYSTNNVTEAEYEASAKLVRFLAAQYNIPLVHLAAAVAPANPLNGTDIIGHYQVPDPNNPSLGGGASHHTDPVNWQWDHYMSLVNGFVAPDKPTNVSPANNAIGQSLTPTLSASSFVDHDFGSTHVASQWLVKRASDGTVVFNSGTDKADLTSIKLASNLLANGAAYTWQVRYKDNYGAWSPYSTATKFTTVAVVQQTGSLSGFTFNDNNNNVMFDSGDVKTSGKTVFLDTYGNDKLDAGEKSQVTDGAGNFTFSSLPIGTYHVRRVFPSGWTYSTAPIDVTLSAGQSITNLAIGSKPMTSTGTGSIAGFTFNDNNKNGMFDAGDVKTGGKTVFLDTNNDGKLESGERSLVTDSSGNFDFTGLVTGTYHLRRVFPSGYGYSTSLIDVVLGNGQNVSGEAIGSKPV
jgi:N-acetyl-anhydromuramyl-L-alanine amidase AmpD